MKQADKSLITIVAVIILLVVTAFTLVLLRPQPQFRDDESPEAVVYNYMLALQQENYERALDQISNDVRNRPQDAAEMEWDVKQNNWQFDRRGDPSLTIAGSRISGEQATVSLNETRSNSPILGDVRSEEIRMRLKLEEDGWKITDGQAYWAEDWGDKPVRQIDS